MEARNAPFWYHAQEANIQPAICIPALRTTGPECPHTGRPKIDYSMLFAVPFCVLRRESMPRWLGPGEAPYPRTDDAGSNMAIAAAQGR